MHAAVEFDAHDLLPLRGIGDGASHRGETGAADQQIDTANFRDGLGGIGGHGVAVGYVAGQAHGTLPDRSDRSDGFRAATKIEGGTVGARLGECAADGGADAAGGAGFQRDAASQ